MAINNDRCTPSLVVRRRSARFVRSCASGMPFSIRLRRADLSTHHSSSMLDAIPRVSCSSTVR